MAQTMSRGEMQDLLMKFSLQDPKYRDKLINDPEDVVEKQFGYDVPEGVKVEAIQETADTVYVVVPHVPEEGEELEDADLEKVAGGFLDKNAECTVVGGAINTQQIFNF